MDKEGGQVLIGGVFPKTDNVRPAFVHHHIQTVAVCDLTMVGEQSIQFL